MEYYEPPCGILKFYLYPKLDYNLEVYGQLETLMVKYNEFLSKFTENYIWYHEPLILKHQCVNYILGKCVFLDCIQDLWYIVFLFRELSKFDPNLFIQLNDEDGEFLLIESALYLPEWAQEPKDTENRVYLHNGELHLVSPKFVNDSSNIIEDCINFILQNPRKARCNDFVQNCINRKLQDYPDAITKSHHNAHCFLPIRLAALLHQHPNLISKAIHAFQFYSPDNILVKRRLEYFKSEKWITSNIRFNRFSFSIFNSEHCSLNYKRLNLPPSNIRDRDTYKNGMKITFGFEIAMKTYETHKISDENKEIEYLSSLNFFRRHMYSAGKLFSQSLDALDPTSLEIIEKIPLAPPDDESWLNVTSEQLEELLKEKFDSEDPMKTENIPAALVEFIKNTTAGVKGAEPLKPFEGIIYEELEFRAFLNEIENESASEMDDMHINDNYMNDSRLEDSPDEMEDENMSDESSSLNEMRSYLRQMDSELTNTTLANSFERAPIDSDDSDEDIRYNAISNIVKSAQEERNTSQGIGPATTLFTYMNKKLSDWNDKGNTQ